MMDATLPVIYSVAVGALGLSLWLGLKSHNLRKDMKKQFAEDKIVRDKLEAERKQARQDKMAAAMVGLSEEEMDDAWDAFDKHCSSTDHYYKSSYQILYEDVYPLYKELHELRAKYHPPVVDERKEFHASLGERLISSAIWDRMNDYDYASEADVLVKMLIGELEPLFKEEFKRIMKKVRPTWNKKRTEMGLPPLEPSGDE
jgi:hypothetical protein